MRINRKGDIPTHYFTILVCLLVQLHIQDIQGLLLHLLPGNDPNPKLPQLPKLPLQLPQLPLELPLELPKLPLQLAQHTTM